VVRIGEQSKGGADVVRIGEQSKRGADVVRIGEQSKGYWPSSQRWGAASLRAAAGPHEPAG
jgi:hypothetical protein